jgi:hypothetical protein
LLFVHLFLHRACANHPVRDHLFVKSGGEGGEGTRGRGKRSRRTWLCISCELGRLQPAKKRPPPQHHHPLSAPFVVALTPGRLPPSFARTGELYPRPARPPPGSRTGRTAPRGPRP